MTSTIPPFDAACRRWRPRVIEAVPTAADDFIDELTGHVAQRWLDAIAAGRTEADADRAARAELSAWIGVRPPARPTPWRPFLGSGLDLRFAFRMLRVRPSFAVSATVLIAVAVGTASAIVAVLYGVLGRPLPYPNADRLVTIWQASPEMGISQVSYPDYLDLKTTGVFEATAAFSGGTGTLAGGVSAERVNALFVEPEMWSMLGAVPLRGRLLTAADSSAPVALISHRLWRSQFGGDEAVVGRTLSLSGRPPVTIVGVLEPGFDFELPVARTFLLANHDVWLPFDTSESFTTRREVSTYQVLATLEPSLALDRARAAVEQTGATLATLHPATNRDRSFRVVPLQKVMVEDARRPLWIAAVGAAILVLAALVNLGGLALARFASRRAELAVRQALGASRFHIIRQVMTEQVPVVILGGLLGGLLGRLAIVAVTMSTSVRLPRPDAIAFDGPAWIAAAVVASAAALTLSVLPLAVASRSSLTSGPSRIVGHVSRRPRRLLVAAEITIALVLCSAAALVSLTLVRLLNVEPGFATTGRLTFRVSAYAAQHPGKLEAVRFFDTVLDRIRALPEVERVAAGSSLPLSGQSTGSHVLSDPAGLAVSDPTVAGWQMATPGFFAAAGTPLLRGRDFTADDQARDAHVTILNATLARALFGNANPLGRRVLAGGGDDWHEVIGVVGDVRHRSLRDEAAPRLYDLAGQHWSRTMYIIVDSRLDDAAGLRDVVIRSVASIDPSAPVFEVASVETLVARAVGAERLASIVATGVGALALLLAAFGVHAVVAGSVAERQREIGVRLALGATRRGVLRLVLGEAGGMALAGGLVGLALAAGAARILAAQLQGLDPADTWPIILVVGAAVTVAAVSAALPAALRAASVDPVRVLQE